MARKEVRRPSGQVFYYDKERHQRIVGNRICLYRELREFSQHQLAVLAGVTQPKICNYERGNLLPSIPTLMRIAIALEVNPGKLLVRPVKHRSP